jgi:hypothetical protein
MTDETPGGDLGSDINPSEEFASFFFLAIDHGFDSIESGGGPLTPFAMTVSASGEKSLHRFAADRLEQGLEMARSHVAANRESVSKYAIAWDGYVTLRGKRTDAILVEAGERGDNRALCSVNGIGMSSEVYFAEPMPSALETRCLLRDQARGFFYDPLGRQKQPWFPNGYPVLSHDLSRRRRAPYDQSYAVSDVQRSTRGGDRVLHRHLPGL